MESAYFQYAVLRVVSWYPKMFDLNDLPLHSSLIATLLKVTSTYHGAFMEMYAGMYMHRTRSRVSDVQL